jgi:hypothetical protein
MERLDVCVTVDALAYTSYTDRASLTAKPLRIARMPNLRMKQSLTFVCAYSGRATRPYFSVSGLYTTRLLIRRKKVLVCRAYAALLLTRVEMKCKIENTQCQDAVIP